MQAPTIPDDEENRLRELERLESMFSGPEESLDRITAQLARIFEVPAAMINFIGRDQQVVKSCGGALAESVGQDRIPREFSMCGHVVAENKMLVVE
ncbi:MAG TPA: hypothetical protein VMD30_09410, partial [Tepidisphaeraceae bacterium]|nr:hypothetical protein [Tepidisphaeraceae bacterium]